MICCLWVALTWPLRRRARADMIAAAELLRIRGASQC